MAIPSNLRNTCGDSPLYKKKPLPHYYIKNANPPKNQKLTDEQIIDIRTKYQHHNWSIEKLSELYDWVTKKHIKRIVNYEVRAKLDVW